MQKLAGTARPLRMSHAKRSHRLGKFLETGNVAREPAVVAALTDRDRIGKILADEFRETAYFIPACLVVAAFLVANVFVMRMLVNIKV